MTNALVSAAAAAPGRHAGAGPDALRLLSGLRDTVDTEFTRCLAASRQIETWQSNRTWRPLLLSLELRLKLDEQLVLPALRDAGAAAPVLDAQMSDLQAIRDLCDQLANEADPPSRRQLVLFALQGEAALHFVTMERLLNLHADALDRLTLGLDIQAMLRRWTDELERTGDIEDEELDPVGLRPR